MNLHIFSLVVSSVVSLTWIFSILGPLCFESVFSMWVGLELNLVSFIWLFSRLEGNLSDMTLKYFLVQSVGSSFLILGMVIHSLVSLVQWVLIYIFALCMKLAMAPFQFWMVDLSKSIGWGIFFLLMTVQKLLPLMILLHFSSLELLMATILLGSGVSLLGAWLSNLVKAIMVYSSVGGLSWMFLGAGSSSSFIYYLIYSLSFLGFTACANEANLGEGRFEESDNFISPLMSVGILFSLFSISGIPPFIGFFGKLAVLSWALSANAIFVSIWMVAIAGIFFAVYFRMTVSLLSNSGSSKLPSSSGFSLWSPLFLFVLFLSPLWFS